MIARIWAGGAARGVQHADSGQLSPLPCPEPPLSNYHCQVQPSSNRRQFQVHRHLDPRTSSSLSALFQSLSARNCLVIASQVSHRHCQSGFASSLPAVTGNLADCKVDGCRRRALRAARAYAVHPSCRFLSRWVHCIWFQGTGRQGRAPINFEKWGGNVSKELSE